MKFCRELGVKVSIKMDGKIVVRHAKSMKIIGGIEFNAMMKRYNRSKR